MIVVEDLSKAFSSKAERVLAVREVSFAAKDGELVTLLGPSGCGKTTTLRLVAGLERADKGVIAIGDRPVADPERNLFEPPHRRHLGMVFQSYAIWPHMTVLENVAYALEGKGLSRAEIGKRARAALGIVHLEDYADRPAPRLSGGQQQRVAIARALAGEPQALLFDEPLSNLDAKLRVEMRSEIKRLQRKVCVTALYVTHDQAEALAISDTIVVMRDGRIVERGTPEEIYRRPKAAFTARFIGEANLIPGRVAATARGANGATAAVDTAAGRFTGIDTSGTLKDGDAALVSIRPEDLRPANGETSDNRLAGTVTETTFAGSAIDVEIAVGDVSFRWLAPRGAQAQVGRAVALSIDPDAAVVLPEEKA